MRQHPFLTVAAAGLALLALAGCQTTSQEARAPQESIGTASQTKGNPEAQAAQATSEDFSGRPSLAAEPREKPQHAKPLADMSCMELQEALLGYGTEIQRYGGRIDAFRPSGGPVTYNYYEPRNASGDVAAAVIMGGALAGLVTAGIARGNWESFQDYKALHAEASKAFNERPCTQELDRIQAIAAAERSTMEQWRGEITVKNPEISSIYAVRACAVHAREIAVATDGRRAVGDIIDRSSFRFPLSGTYEPRSGRILLQGAGAKDASYRIKGKFARGSWTWGDCKGTYRMSKVHEAEPPLADRLPPAKEMSDTEKAAYLRSVKAITLNIRLSRNQDPSDDEEEFETTLEVRDGRFGGVEYFDSKTFNFTGSISDAGVRLTATINPQSSSLYWHIATELDLSSGYTSQRLQTGTERPTTTSSGEYDVQLEAWSDPAPVVATGLTQ